jgi:hypothetical protein
MAKQPTHPPVPAPTPTPSDQGGANLESVGGVPTSPASPTGSGATQEAKSSPPDNGGNGGSGGPAPEGPSPKGDRELPAVQPDSTRPSAFTSGDGILQAIADRWDKAREIGKVGAFLQLQRDLMNAAPFIVPHIIPYKDLISIVTDLEKEIKGSNAQVGKSNEELLSDFLNGGGDIIIKELDKGVTMVERDESAPDVALPG